MMRKKISNVAHHLGTSSSIIFIWFLIFFNSFTEGSYAKASTTAKGKSGSIDRNEK